ncbi:MAG TPA: hypothetical protein VFH85_07075 [Gammaproteobacteria bacterium]|nr:hypothetical protein [Gammaproteobacteria bacterium]
MASEAESLERQRILLLLKRGGRAAARAWVERTRRLYAEAIAAPHSHAAQPQYRPHFEASIRVFDDWLDNPSRVESAAFNNNLETRS